jgi:DNA-binding transcriptional LysR family regulator
VTEDLDFKTLAMLEAVISLRSVQAAAKKLGLTPSAVSHGLRRLRVRTGDDLVTQTSRGMEPTARGLVIVEATRAAVGALRASLSDRVFDPAIERRTFVVQMADYAASVVGPELTRRVLGAGPGLTIKMARLGVESELALESEVDLVIGPLGAETGRLQTQRLFSDTFLCAARPEHPRFGRELDLETYLGLEHVCVAPQGARGSLVDTALAEMSRARNIRAVTPFFFAALALARASDLVVTLPALLLTRYAPAFELQTRAPAFALPKITMRHTWHRRREGDSGHAWLRQTLVEIGKDLRAPS